MAPHSTTVTTTVHGRLVALAVLSTGLAAGLLTQASGLGADLPTGSLLLGSVIIAALAYATHMFPLAIEYRGETPMVTLRGVPLALGLIYLGPLPTLTALLVGVAAYFAGRQRQPGIKVLINLSATALEVAASASVLVAIAGSQPNIGAPQGWLGLTAGIAAGDMVAGLIVIAAVRTTEGRMNGETFRAFMASNMITTAVEIPVAVLSALVLSIDLRAGLLLIPFAGLLAQTNRQRHVMSERYKTSNALYQFIASLAKIGTTPEVLRRVLEHSHAVGGADQAYLLVTRGATATLWQDLGEHLVGRDVPQATAQKLLDRAQQGLLVDLGDEAEAAVRRVLTLQRGQALIGTFANVELRGALILTDVSAYQDRFEPDDVQLVKALAGHAGTALESSHLFNKVQSESIRRERMALVDANTELPNRNGLLDERPRLSRGAVFVVGIRDMSAFGTSFGHEVSESVAVKVGARLQSEAKDSGVTVARIGAAHFAVRVDRPCDPAQAEAWARRLVETASGPVQRGGLVIDVAVRVGIALAPHHGTDMRELLRAADLALIAAQESHRAVGWFEFERDRETTRRLELASELRAAIDGNYLRLAYQPKVDLATGRVIGVEALARWPHAERGFISPRDFIDIAERTGLIKPLTVWATQTAVSQAATWRAQGLDLSIAINLSNAAITDRELPWEIVRIVESLEVPANSVVMEITESQLLDENDTSGGALSIFHAAGLQLSVDDFGTGYSSLANLKTLQVNELKIDRAFIKNIHFDRVDQALCAAMITMARELGLTVVAEGIENPAALDILRELGCDVGQGYYFEHPLPASEIPRAIAELEAMNVHGTVTRLQDRVDRRNGS